MINKKQGGVTLIEILAVFAIGAAVVGVAITKYLEASNKNKIRFEAENLNFMFHRTTEVFDNQKTTLLDNDFALESGIFPKLMRKNLSTGEVENVWQGDVVVSGYGDYGFEVRYDNVLSNGSCFKLLSDQKSIGWTSYSIDGSSFHNFYPFDLVLARDMCKSTAKNFGTIIFRREI